MNNNFLYIANWKMYFNFNEEIEWINKNINDLNKIAQNNSLVICPSFVSLNKFNEIIEHSYIKLGAQNCAQEEKGAFTGEISPISLKQTGCTYCIVGHSEQRLYNKETDEVISKKVKLLLKNNITPIICIGETKKEYDAGTAHIAIEKQLITILKDHPNVKQHIIIAYEPIWSIGTDAIPSADHIKSICAVIHATVDREIDALPHLVVYGGSVNSSNINKFKEISCIDGFLIGRASTDFQELKKIVLS